MMRRMRIASAALGLGVACSRADQPGPVAQLSVGPLDTLIVNSLEPTVLPVRALDASGRTVPSAQLHFTTSSNVEFPISSDGVVTCRDRREAHVRVVIETVSRTLMVTCRPIDRVQVSGPVQFVLGDSALSRPVDVPLVAYAPDRRPVAEIAGVVRVLDTSKVYARGSTLFPKSRGTTLVGVWTGGKSAWTGVHVYQRVDSLASLDTLLRVDGYRRQFAVRIQLVPGQFQHRRLPPGDWMITTLAASRHTPSGLQLHFEDAVCEDNILNEPGRFICKSTAGAVVVVYRSSEPKDTLPITGYLLVRGLYPPAKGQ